MNKDPKFLEQIIQKKILILGMAQEGTAVAKFLKNRYPQKPFAVADLKEFKNLSKNTKDFLEDYKDIKQHFGTDYLSKIRNYDVIIKAPGVPPTIPELREAVNSGIMLTSLTEIFFNLCQGRIIGVTGTKGKSTTTKMIHHILTSANKEAHLVGNIGNPPLQLLSKDRKSSIYVFELSSYQLDNLELSPDISILLNLYPEHLKYHENFQNYSKAKENITKHQDSNDILIYNAGEELIEEIANRSKAAKYAFSLKPQKKSICYFKNGQIYYEDSKIIEPKEVTLPGEFNLQNIMPGIIVGKLMDIDDQTIKSAIKSFKPLEHRMEYCGEFSGIKFYNNSIATIPQATIEAIKHYGKNLHTIMLGGYDRNLDFSKLGEKIIESSIRKIILFPDTGQKIWEAIERAAEKNTDKSPEIDKFEAKSMKQAVETAYQETPKGKICLLSPASPSYTLFKNFEDEGHQFKRYIKELNPESSL